MSDIMEVYADRPARDRALHLGMWLFLGSETLLFAGLFALYAAYRAMYDVDFRIGVEHNNDLIGTINTLVLITSSFFVAWAVHSLRHGNRRMAMLAIGGAILLGLTFLGLKAVEYDEHFAEGLYPGGWYSSAEYPSGGARMFYTLYYALTGLHAIHVIAGLLILSWLLVRIKRRRTHQGHRVELELGGLYWHLVDVVWIFLWPLLYLTR